MLFKRLLHWLPSLLGIALLGVCIWAIGRELQQYQIGEILHSLAAIPKHNVILAIALTLLNCIAFTGYDTLAVHYVRYPLPYCKTALAAITSIPVANSVGFALLSSSAIRYRFYASWGLSPAQIAQIIAFCNLSFWLGLFAVGGIAFILKPIAVPTLLHLPFSSVHPIGAIFLSVIAAYLLWNLLNRRSLRIRNWVVPHLPVSLCLAQIAVSCLDWSLAAAVLYTLLPATPSLTYSAFFGIYLLAQLAGVVSNVPGGLGVFETVILLLLKSFISSATLFGALLAYRAIYYLLPLSIAVLLLGLYELRQR